MPLFDDFLITAVAYVYPQSYATGITLKEAKCICSRLYTEAVKAFTVKSVKIPWHLSLGS